MAKRKRRGVQPGEFEDPLSNYDGPEYADELERSLCEDSVTVVEHKPFSTVEASTKVADVLRQMADKDIACVLIEDDSRLVGIFSARDVLEKLCEQYEQVKDQPIRQVMTPRPVSIYEADPPAHALNLMAVGGFRHVPILDVDEKVVGVLGPRRIISYLESHFEDA